MWRILFFQKDYVSYYKMHNFQSAVRINNMLYKMLQKWYRKN